MHRKKIVVIDDCQLTLAVARDMLESEGYEVATASATIEANPLIFCTPPPDLIMVDVEMPLLNGPQTVVFLKSRTSSKDISVLMISAKSRDELSEISREAGADGFVCKPLLPQVLLPQVKTMLAS
jgi:DNA-binding response OmpR family regulator